jgi:hypothetical protein
MRIQIDDNSAALTPFGSLVSAAVRVNPADKPWTIALHADRTDRQGTPNALPAVLLTTAMIAVILIGVAKNPQGTSFLGQSNATSSYGTFNGLHRAFSDHR